MHEALAQFVASGHIALLALAVLVAETITLIAWRARASAAPATVDLVLMALPGACLMLALYCALVGSDWPALLACLSAALVTHVADVARRWQLHEDR